MDSECSARNLAETIHSLLGLKAHLTSAWIESVCNIVENLQLGKPEESNEPLLVSETEGIDGAVGADLGSVIPKLKDEIAVLQQQLNQLNCRRRHVLNEYLDLKGNIRVFCRIRPLLDAEAFSHATTILSSDTSNIFLQVPGQGSKSYGFDKVFEPCSSQVEIFSEVEPLIKSALDGFNACIFAYGQTGTGKTFTMEGTPDFPGVVPRAIEALFKHTYDSNNMYSFSFSMLEIYMGNLKDLLVTQPKKPTDPLPLRLSIQTGPKGGIEVENLAAIRVSDYNQALKLYQWGCRVRSAASTNLNLASSRSHCMTRILITCSNQSERQREMSKVWLVDLGGSERVLKTKACGRRFKEGQAINRSLSALGDVINALHRKKRHIPFRNSKLTQVLQDSLGEDSKALVLVHLSPRKEDICETICTLSFATRVNSIRLGNKGDTKEKVQKEALMQNLQKAMDDIEGQCRDLEGEIRKLNKGLVNLIGSTSSSSSYDEDCSMKEGAAFEVGIMKNKFGNGGADRSKLPRFMMPTICSSQRKFGMSDQSGRGMPPYRKASLVIFPVKSRSEYKSECGNSTASLGDLKSICSTDNGTECSQDMSANKCDMKMVVSSDEVNSYPLIKGKERIIKDLSDRLNIPLPPKHPLDGRSIEDGVFPDKLNVGNFKLKNSEYSSDRDGLVWQESKYGCPTSETDGRMDKVTHNATDSFSLSTFESATESAESAKSSITEDDRAINLHSPHDTMDGFDNSVHDDDKCCPSSPSLDLVEQVTNRKHEHGIPESNCESEEGKALFQGNSTQNIADKGVLPAGAEGTKQHMTGHSGNLRRKILQILLVVLVGVGLQSLVFQHDFFHGLTIQTQGKH